MIELLVVISIISILMAILVPTIGMIRQGVRKAQAKSLCSAVAQALATTALSRGSPAPLVPHPLAGSRDLPRLAFSRGEAVAGCVVGGAVAISGEELMLGAPSTLSGGPATLLLLSDRFSGVASGIAVQPLLYGVRRDALTIVGSAAGLVGHRLLPAVGPVYDQNGDGILDPPSISTRYPDNRYLITDASVLSDLESQSAKIMEIAFASADLQDLSSRRSLVTTTSGTALLGGRLYQSGTTTAAAWQPGLVWNGTAWVSYRLRGAALYDPWGRELLCSTDQAGNITVSSAGPDGVFRWNPGPDGVFQTAPEASVPAGDDRDGSLDNITSR